MILLNGFVKIKQNVSDARIAHGEQCLDMINTNYNYNYIDIYSYYDVKIERELMNYQ